MRKRSFFKFFRALGNFSLSDEPFHSFKNTWHNVPEPHNTYPSIQRFWCSNIVKRARERLGNNAIYKSNFSIRILVFVPLFDLVSLFLLKLAFLSMFLVLPETWIQARLALPTFPQKRFFFPYFFFVFLPCSSNCYLKCNNNSKLPDTSYFWDYEGKKGQCLLCQYCYIEKRWPFFPPLKFEHFFQLGRQTDFPRALFHVQLVCSWVNAVDFLFPSLGSLAVCAFEAGVSVVVYQHIRACYIKQQSLFRVFFTYQTISSARN